VNARRRRIAFVVDRFAPTTYGGAPLYAHRLAAHLAQRFETELLTTTAQDYMTWANAFAPGTDVVDGVTVRRFAIDAERDVPRFDRLSRRLLRARRPSLAAQERWMGAQGPLSLDLLRYIATERAAYDAFVFVSYLYATTYFGLPLVADRALLVPLAHDEWPIRFPMWNRIFSLPRGFAYNTMEERAFTQRRFPNANVDGPVIGAGVEAPPDTDRKRFRARYGIDGRFALYLGRVDPSKGCADLVRTFRRTRAQHGRSLVLVGEPYMNVRAGDGVLVTGPVDDATKWDALAACDVLVLPSRYESLSFVALEAWAMGKPVLANARAAAVAGQIERSGGGLTYTTDAEFAGALTSLDATRATEYGARGRAFVDEHYRWPVIEARFAEHLATVFGWHERSTATPARRQWWM
jgi:glycosyltransferase involved in cell wall biosynthesis